MNFFIFAIFLLVMIYSIKLFLLLFPLFMVLSPKALLLIQTSSLPLLSVSNAIMIVLLILFLMHLIITNQWKYFIKYDLKIFTGFFFLLLSYILVLLYSSSTFVGIHTVLIMFLAILLPAFLYSYYFQQKDISFHIKEIKLTFIILFILGIYASISIALESNIYVDFIEAGLHTDRMHVSRYTGDWRGERAIGTLTHPITYGAFIGIGFFASLFLIIYYSSIMKNPKMTFLFVFLSLFMIFFIFISNSRTPLIFVLTGITIIFFYSNVKIKIYVILAILLLLPIIMQIDFFNQKILGLLNIFNSDIGEDQRGSSISMRLSQLSVSYDYFINSPIFGNGFQSTRNIVASGIEPDLYNAESIIYKILIDMGIVGILGYSIFFTWFYFLIYKLKYVYKPLKGLVYAYISGYIIYIMGTGVMDTMQMFVFVFYLFYLTLKSLENDNRQYIIKPSSKKTYE